MDGQGYEIIDLEDIGYLDDIGARRRAPQRGRGRGRQMQQYQPRGAVFGRRPTQQIRQSPPVVQQQSGVSPIALKYVPFGFSTAVMGVGVTTGTLKGSPQIPIKPRKLILSVQRVGAGVVNAIIQVQTLMIGAVNQMAGLDPIDASMFSDNVQGATMDLSPAGPGIIIQIQVISLIAPAAAESITVAGGFLVEAVST